MHREASSGGRAGRPSEMTRARRCRAFSESELVGLLISESVERVSIELDRRFGFPDQRRLANGGKMRILEEKCCTERRERERRE